MKIHEMAKISGINPETIRSYRLKNLLHPKKLPNGYYDYSVHDLISLLYTRKLRGYSVALNDIDAVYNSHDPGRILEVIDAEQQAVNLQIARLQEELRYLELERMHIIASSITNSESVQVMQSIDNKIDVYDLDHAPQEVFDSVRKAYNKMTPTIRIRKETLNGPCEDRMIDIETGFGTYQYVIEENSLYMPTQCVIVPNGIHIGQMIATDDLNRINLLLLKPMMDYAKKQGTPFISDTTGYLMHIERQDDRFVYHFRIRACIEENSIVSYKP